MSERELPEYGEYATPEEQAAAIRASGGIVPTPAPSGPPQPPSPPPRAAAGTAGLLNRFVTILLLSFGLFSLLQSGPGYLDFGATLDAFYASQGIGDYEAGPLTAPLGVSALVLHGLVWAASAWWTIALLRRGRQSWWIPLVGFVVAFAIVSALVAVLLLQDPVFLDYLTNPAV